MNISKEFENIKTRYVNFYKEPEIKIKAIENLVNVELHNQLQQKDEIENVADYNVELFGMGDYVYRIRMNYVYTIVCTIRNGNDINTCVQILMNHIWYQNRYFEDKVDRSWR